MKPFLLSLLCLFTISACAVSASSMDVDPNQTTFEVKLPANPTTGFQWTVLQYDKTILELKNHHYIAPKTKLVGAGGTMVFTFALIKNKALPKNTMLSFQYARSWEPNSGQTKQVSIHFRASASTKDLKLITGEGR